jgi:hypothetical protein
MNPATQLKDGERVLAQIGALMVHADVAKRQLAWRPRRPNGVRRQRR